MDTLKRLLLQLYFRGTSSYRRRTVHEWMRRGRAPIVVPVFHRIADDRANNWTTRTSEFCEAIFWLKEKFDLISLDEAQRRIESGANHRPSVSLTFDDGYAVNCERALPLLIELGIPCTYFVSTHPVLDGAAFEHDRAMGNYLAPNSLGELRALAAAGIEIGAHTRTHVDLGRVCDAERLFDELVIARSDLEAALGVPVRYFAFPFGLHQNLTAAAFRLAREAGYAGVCSAYGGYNFPGDDAFHLQRRCVDGQIIRLKNWASIDPLHLRRIERFDYQQPLPPREAAVSGAIR
ncbi:MAG TPA: polysaccharide deacetylase family protein [Pirellulales bacterium]|nr:polysaccharide deacetylase family protein [Pirellulales bacterium]